MILDKASSEFADMDTPGRFSPAQATRMLEPLEAVDRWIEEPPAGVAREQAAAARLAAALRARSEGEWAIAGETLERMLQEDKDSLLVLLLSDGSPWKEPEPPLEESPVEGEQDTAVEPGGGTSSDGTAEDPPPSLQGQDGDAEGATSGDGADPEVGDEAGPDTGPDTGPGDGEAGDTGDDDPDSGPGGRR